MSRTILTSSRGPGSIAMLFLDDGPRGCLIGIRLGTHRPPHHHYQQRNTNNMQVRIAQEGRICKHIAAAAIIALAPQVQAPSPTNGSMKANGGQTAEVSPLLFRIRRNVQTDGKNGVQVEVQARVTNDEAQDR